MGKDRYLRTSQSAFSAGSESGDTRGPDRAHKKKKRGKNVNNTKQARERACPTRNARTNLFSQTGLISTTPRGHDRRCVIDSVS